MSECELPEFYDVKEPVARKEYRCCECRARIFPGEKYAYCVGKWAGEISVYRQHLLCANACRHIRDESDGECIAFGGLKEYMAGCWHDPVSKRHPATAKLRKMFASIRIRERRAALAAGESKETNR